MLLAVMLLLFFYSEKSVAQSVETLSLNRVQPISLSENLQQNSIGNLNIVAVMVEFQPDTNRFTSGNGTFDQGSIPYLENPGTNIDALPHNRAYFESHLEFAKNYFERVSGQLLTIDYTVLPEIIRLDNEMAYYSPIGLDPDNRPLGDLARDVWTKVEENGGFDATGLDPETTAFIIFHAGIGRDIELTGTILDKTPQDIPSVYISRDAFGRLFDNPSFSGFEMNNGSFLIKNSLIMPRTLSRSGEDVTGQRFVLSLSINGLLAAQIGSHIGLPDLFNTENGRSGIGQFGLMDGAGIFAKNGLFPPEPSAWEKIHAGWITPFTIQYDEAGSIDLPAASLRQPNSIAKVNISVDEYFLIENRHRDPDDEGVTLTIRNIDGTLVQQTFFNSDLEFIQPTLSFGDLIEPGVVVDVSNFDFALPGGLDRGDDGIEGTADDRNLNGGMLIWHIDEGVIRRTIGDQKVNADPDRRGVNLMEADGAQDIGRPVAVGLSDNNPNGSPFDYWWSGNNATVITQSGRITLYENRFGPDTTPNNNSNSGSVSFFELYDFSDNLPVASFNIRPASSPQLDVELVFSTTLSGLFGTPLNNPFLNRFPYGITIFNDDAERMAIIPGLTSVQAVDLNTYTDYLIQPEPSQQPLITNSLILAELPLQNDITVTSYSWNAGTENFDTEWSTTAERNFGFISTDTGITIDLDHSVDRIEAATGNLTVPDPQPIQRSDSRGSQSLEINATQFRINFDNLIAAYSSPLGVPALNNRVYTGYLGPAIAYLFGNDRFYSQNFNGDPPTVLAEGMGIDWPAMADINGDGFADVIFTDPADGSLMAVNQYGSLLDYFPFSPPAGVRFTGTPLLADITGNNEPEIITGGYDENSFNLYAFDLAGKAIAPFPLLVGGLSDQVQRFVNPVIDGNEIIAVSAAGDLKIWTIPSMGDIILGQKYGDNGNKVSAIFDGTTAPEPDFGILNKTETYNWPNPARDETNLRFQTSDAGEVSIRITTLSGRLIYENTVPARGGLAEEIRIDTSTWGSGGYFARVEARVNGRTESKIVKIAVVR
jgi:hypothetical protein